MTDPTFSDDVGLQGNAGPLVVSGDGLAVPVPSGLAVTFLDVVLNAPGPEGLAARFRFVAPQIKGGAVEFEVASADMAHLCQNFALQRVAKFGPVPSQIIISLSDSAVPFGEAAPDVTQFFEAYRIEDERCIWEAF